MEENKSCTVSTASEWVSDEMKKNEVIRMCGIESGGQRMRGSSKLTYDRMNATREKEMEIKKEEEKNVSNQIFWVCNLSIDIEAIHSATYLLL